MRMFLVAFVLLWITTGILCAQSSSENGEMVRDSIEPVFTLVGEDSITIFHSYTYKGLDKLLTKPLSNSHQSRTVILKSYDALEPTVPLKIAYINSRTAALCIRVPGLSTQVLGYFDLSSCFIMNVAKDSITENYMFELIEEYVKRYVKYAQDPQIQKGPISNEFDVFIAIDDKGVAEKILENTVNRINQYASAECIAFHPESKAALIKYRAANFIPQWKWALIDLFLIKETKGKYGIDNLKDMDEETSNKLRTDFLKKLDDLTQ